jgi:hypothetical protein
MVNKILPEAVTRFREKSSDYGEVFRELGLAGQYSDMHRKMHKLKKWMWDGEELKGEQVDEILQDLFGNILISLYLYHEEVLRGTQASQRAAGSQPSSRQNPGSYRTLAVDPEGRARQQEGDAVRKPSSS